MFDRRRVLTCLFAASLAAGAAGSAVAQVPYPNRPITLVLPYAAGGGTDAIARVFAKSLEERLGGSIIVDNRPGAGGNIATDAVAASPADGYTLIIGNQGPMVVSPHLFKSLKSDPEKTLEPIGLIADAALMIVVGPRLKVTTLTQLIAAAKTSELAYASASNASASHLAALLLQRATGFKARHVAYRGAGPALNDLVGGHVDFMITTIPSATGLILGKQLTALAVTGAARADALPDIPTAIEAGVPGFMASTWYGLLAPRGLPDAVRAKLEAGMNEALKEPVLAARLKDDGARPATLRGAAFGAFMAEERKRWGEVVRQENLSIKE